MFEKVALVWLVPVDLIRRHRSDVEAVHIWGGNKAINQIRVGSDCCNDKARPQSLRYFFLSYFDDANKGKHKLLIRHSVLGVFAENYCRQQIGTAVADSKPCAVTMRGGYFRRAWFIEAMINQLRNSLRHVSIDEGCQLRLWIISRAWMYFRQPFG